MTTRAYPFSTLRRAFAFVAALLLCAVSAWAVPPNKVLFDATKAQMASNADWVIDADTHNIGTSSTTHLMVAGAGTESNPQRFPTPASGITASTPETYWTGALSSWGIELVKRGFAVETLPYNGAITYGNASNPQDLANYGIYIIDEPNISFSATETAIINFVAAGGGLFVISDHNNSDRNSDGVDSVDVLNDLVNNNSVSSNVFGITFNYVDVSPTSTFVATSATDPLIHGPAGAVSQMIYHNGATLTITGANTHGAIWQTSAKASTAVMVAYATYGLGKVVACGDSSPFDDGTGDSNDSLFNGWSGEANGDHGRLAINACLWLNPSAACTAPAVAPLPATASSCGTPVTLTAAAIGTGPLSYQWRKNGSAIITGTEFTGANTASLTINPVTAADAASYDVIVTNACGNTTSTATVLTKNVAPSISASPISIIRCAGTSSFTVTTTGTPAPTYQWRKGGIALANSGAVSGVTTATLTINTITAASAGSYEVVVTNTCSSATSTPATLTVNEGAAITQQPAPVAVCPDATAGFAVAASGTTPTYRWQWQQVGTPLIWTNLTEGLNTNSSGTASFSATGTTSTTVSLTRAALATGAIDPISAVRCVITNSCGTLNSNPATLTVNTCSCALADIASDSADTARNPNGTIGPEDLEAFVNAFIADNAALADVASDSADTTYNPNGSVGPEDLEAFVNGYIAGC